MTAEELINSLKELPPEIKIVVRGYEEGFNDISQLKPLKLMHAADSKWYYGEYFKNNMVFYKWKWVFINQFKLIINSKRGISRNSFNKP